MLFLKKCNYLTGEPNHLGFGVAQIIDFLENDGRNILLITPPRGSTEDNRGISTSIKYLYNNQFTFENFSEFESILANKSNLFRVDLLVFDFFHLKVWQIKNYKKIIDELDVEHIIIANQYNYKYADDVNDFLIQYEYHQQASKSELFIIDKINNYKITLQSLSISYLRDKKIDKLFGND